MIAIRPGSVWARPSFSVNQYPGARLIRIDLEKLDTKAVQDLRARALDGIAKICGIPKPGTDASLKLGLAALKRLLGAYPPHPLAVQAAYQILQSYLARVKARTPSGLPSLPQSRRLPCGRRQGQGGAGRLVDGGSIPDRSDPPGAGAI